MPRFHQIRAFTFDFASATPIYRFVVEGRPATAGSKVPIRRKDGGVFLMDMSKRGPAWRKAVAAMVALSSRTEAAGDAAEGKR